MCRSVIFLLGPSYKLRPNFYRFYAIFGLIPSGVGLYVYANCALAIQRLIAVLFPHQYRRFVTPIATRCFIIIPWVISMLMHSFLATGVINFSVIQSKERTIEHCFIRSSDDRKGIAVSMYIVTQMHIPLRTIGIAYSVLLIKTVIELRREKKKPYNVVRIDMLRRRLDISRGLFVSFLWHIVGTYQLIYTSGVIPPDTLQRLSKIRPFLRVLAASYSALNPV